MKKICFMILIFIGMIFIPFSNSFAATPTKYPIILAHGMGATAQNLGVIDYWWGIDNALENAGFKVYKTSVNGMDSTRAKAISFKEQFFDILADSGASKINIIGHSHGTIYTRDAISNLGLAPYVASYTSLCGPHQGSKLADLIMNGVPEPFRSSLAGSMDFLYEWILGDSNPNSLENGIDVTTSYMKNIFNPNTPNISGIYYQSWAAKVKLSCPNIILEPSWLVMLVLEGANDGLVSVNSAKWGNFRGIQDGAWYSPGVDHFNMVDQFFGITPGFDAPDFFVSIAKDLQSRGF